MRILGVDPGTYRMGVGVVESDGTDFTALHFDVIAPPQKDPLSRRLDCIFERLTEIVARWQPTEMAVEEPFAGKNIKAAMAIGQAQAIALLVAARAGLDVSVYAPAQVKRAVVDHGDATKEQVQEMVQVILGLDTTPKSTDAADALAVAICHINASRASTLEMRE